MIRLNLHLEGDGVWPDLKEALEQGRVSRATELSLAALSGGMVSGNPSVAIRLDLEDGRVAIAEISLRLLLMAAYALRDRYPLWLDRSGLHFEPPMKTGDF